MAKLDGYNYLKNLTDWVDKKDMRLDKSLKIEVQTLSGEKVSKSLRY